MLNPGLGKTGAIDGTLSIATRRGAAGHALYGPYTRLEPGDYAVEFEMTVIGNDTGAADDAVCAIIDVASNVGNTVLARRELKFSEISHNKSGAFYLTFHLDKTSGDTEFRVYVTGKTELRIANYCRPHRLADSGENYLDFFKGTKFPDASAWRAADVPSSLMPPLRGIYENGGEIRIKNGHVVATLDGVSFNVAMPDDIRFIDEIFYRNTYNAMLNRPSCVIDIGMNIGLVSLKLAKNPIVWEVHAFEPFHSTYERAMANIGLNSDVSDKIVTYNVALADRDDEFTVLIADESDSGAFSIRSARTGSPKKIAMRNAASALGPIIRSAKKRKLEIIAKIDCEGSEFPIFEQLDANNLIPDVTAFMVEWHRGPGGKTQHDLTSPLLRHGFLVFDVSARKGNGFFYAVRTSRSAAQPTSPP
jgi:FkbM family methyltransferase